MRAKKSLGQHFLMHPATARRIVAAAKLAPEDTVLEIGPGTGMLTSALLEQGQRVIAVETDAEMVMLLQTTAAVEIQREKLVLIQDDIRSFDPGTIVGPYALVANIPYYITGEIMRHFLTAAHQPSSMTLLVQKEVAERIARAKKESLLSLSVKAYGVPRYCFTVPKGAFKPAPKVDSAVLSISNINRSAFSTAAEEALFFRLLHAGFAHKRKFLAKNLEIVVGLGAGVTLLHEVGIALKARAEDIPLDAWLRITKRVAESA